MSVLEIYLKTENGIHGVADRLRCVLNLPDRNTSPYQLEQERDSANKGGVYFLFECFGLVLELLRNSGEVMNAERSEWSHYLVVYSEHAEVDESTLRVLADHVCSLLRKHGIDAEVETV